MREPPFPNAFRWLLQHANGDDGFDMAVLELRRSVPGRKRGCPTGQPLDDSQRDPLRRHLERITT